VLVGSLTGRSAVVRTYERLVKLVEEACDAPGRGGVTFHLAAPAVLGCLFGQGEFSGIPLAEPWGVGGGGDELRAGEVEIAFTPAP
jgi:hypothetical protein